MKGDRDRDPPIVGGLDLSHTRAGKMGQGRQETIPAQELVEILHSGGGGDKDLHHHQKGRWWG